MKPYADNKSKAFSNSSVLKRANIRQRTGTNAYSIKHVRMNKCGSIRIEQRQLKVDQWEFCSLIDDLHMQLDDKMIKDSKDHLWRKKCRESAKVYMHDLYEVGRAEFIIDPRDLLEEARSGLYKLDDDSAEYVIRESYR